MNNLFEKNKILLLILSDKRSATVAVCSTILILYLYDALNTFPPAVLGTEGGGWWGWWDQGKYLESARAFSAFDFTSDRHWYPPGYSLLGAAFVALFPSNPFLPINALCLLGGCFLFRDLCHRLRIGPWTSAIAFVLSMVSGSSMILQTAIPWSSTPVFLLYAAIFWIYVQDDKAKRHFFAVGLLAGSVLLFRPTDIVATTPVLLALLGDAVSRWTRANAVRETFALVGMMAVGGALPALLAVALHLATHGMALSPYLLGSQQIGFSIGSLPVKLYALMIDPNPAYTENVHPYLGSSVGFFEKYKWSLVSVFGMAVAVLDRSKLTVIAACIVVHIVLYAAYVDLLPTGIWRYYNIHYFKWCFPFLMLFALYGLKRLSTVAGRRTAVRAAALTLPLLAISMTSTPVPVAHAAFTDQTVVLTLAEKQRVDAITLTSVQGVPVDVYFSPHSVTADGRDLAHIREVRAIPTRDGARIVFIAPVEATTIRVTLADGKATIDPAQARATVLRLGFEWGWPCWLAKAICRSSGA